MKGIINLYKEKGISSAQAVSKIKKILNQKRVGHMGTLDPLAEGVLLIGVGKGTKLFDHFLGKDKIYEAEFTFGFETDTLDGEGKTINTSEIMPNKEHIENILHKLVGKYGQIPPQYSAKSVNGVRAYNLARQGKEVVLKESQIEVFEIKLLSSNPPKFNFFIHCSSGTYIRSICRDLAYLLNTFATMTALKRIKCGKYDIENSVNFEQIEQDKQKSLQSIEQALQEFPKIHADLEQKKLLDNGVKIKIDNLPDKFLLYCEDTLYGIAKNDNGYAKITTYLKD